jgi:hypothetical protein
MTHRSGHFPARLLAVSGVAGLVIATAAWAAPSAGAAPAPTAAASHPAAAAAPAKASAPASCSKSVSKLLQVTAHLSSLHATGQYQKKTNKTPARVVLALKGSPSLGLHLTFSGEVDCTKSLTGVKIPIGGSSLFLTLTPELEFDASGDVGANFTWTENVNVGFTVSGTKFTQGAHSLTSGTKVVFSGNGSVDMKLDLEAAIETAGGIVGVKGTVGPDITGMVTDDTGDGATCWSGSYSTEAVFGAYLNVYFFEKTFSSPAWHLGKTVPIRETCAGGEDE